jgi:hypothetical protein
VYAASTSNSKQISINVPAVSDTDPAVRARAVTSAERQQYPAVTVQAGLEGWVVEIEAKDSSQASRAARATAGGMNGE